MGSARHTAAAVSLLLLLCAQLAAANVRADNFHNRHLLHAEHAQHFGSYYQQLAPAPAGGEGVGGAENGVWHYNDEAAPVVNKESIEKARLIEMEDDAAADAAAKAAKAAAEFEEHKAINAEVVARITAPYVGDNPIWYLVKGFGVIFLITFGFYWAERYWLKESLSLPDIMNEDITRRMYPLF